MLYFGIAISVSGVILYIVSAVLFNYYLSKNTSDAMKQFDSRSGASRRKQKGDKGKEIRIVVTENATPGWVALLGSLAMPVFLIGVAVIILSLIVRAFS